jgi:SpoIIAA-like
MSLKLAESDGGKVMQVQVSGKLSAEDYKQFVPEFERRLQKDGKIRVLFDMTDFHGWDAGALWEDIKFDLKHFGDIERVAMVGDKKWEKGMSLFCRPFTKAKVRYFDHGQAKEAHTWVAAE